MYLHKKRTIYWNAAFFMFYELTNCLHHPDIITLMYRRPVT